jgi:uncharacterized membrane protein YhiD involved in acid resistance
MFELFPDQPALEYPQLVNITYSFLWSFVLSSVIAITHKFTFTGDHYPKNYFQSLILGAVATTLVMMAVGDSLARGLGVFGAMAIIRFRTRIDDPRDVLFLFASLSTGLSIGVYGFTISFVGSLLFCLVAIALYFSPFKSFSNHTNLFFTTSNTDQYDAVTKIILQYCLDYRVITLLVNKENAMRYQYAITLKESYTKEDLVNAIKEIEGVKQIKLTSSLEVTSI